jgi:DeoR/GlpR family transcriptional regulator of sugar metabolism
MGLVMVMALPLGKPGRFVHYRIISCNIIQAVPGMLTTQRKQFLLDRLKADGRIVATSIAHELGTSEDTVRRDLRELAAEGFLLRVHGGALPASPTNRPMTQRRDLHREAKARLGREGASLIQSGELVLIDGGTTNLALVAALPPRLRATIVTHSPEIATALEHFEDIEVVVIGGSLFRHSMVAVGATTQDAYGRIRADRCFVGVTGVHAETGLTTGHSEEATVKARMIASAAETVILVTPDKIGVASAWQIAPLAVSITLVTADPPPDWLSLGATCRIAQ